MKIKISFDVDLHIPSVLDDDEYTYTMTKSEFNKRVKEVVFEVIDSTVKDGLIENDFEGKVQKRLIEYGHIQKS